MMQINASELVDIELDPGMKVIDQKTNKHWYVLGNCTSDTFWCMDSSANHDELESDHISLISDQAKIGSQEICMILFEHIFKPSYFTECMKSNHGLYNFSSSLWWLAHYTEVKFPELSIWLFVAAGRANPHRYAWVFNTIESDIKNHSHEVLKKIDKTLIRDISEVNGSGRPGHFQDALNRCKELVQSQWPENGFPNKPKFEGH